MGTLPDHNEYLIHHQQGEGITYTLGIHLYIRPDYQEPGIFPIMGKVMFLPRPF